MKTTGTTFIVVLALTGSLLATKAQAGGFGHSTGGFSGGSRSAGSFASQVSHTPSAGSLHYTNVAAVQNFHQTNVNKQADVNNLNKLGPVNKVNTVGGKNLTDKLNLNKGTVSNFNKSLAKFDFSKSMKAKYFPSKFWGGCGWGGWCGWGGCWSDWYCGGWWPECYCYQPWYYTPCYNVCCEYYAPEYPSYCSVEPVGSAMPDAAAISTPATPAVKMVHVINPAETQTALSFAVNGQTYSLDAGKTQDLELNDNTVIEFDRGSGNDLGRYTLSAGAYRFGSTPQGWELYRSNNAPLADAVAAN